MLVVGDPLGATTHTDMLLRAKELSVETQVNFVMDIHLLLAVLTGKNAFVGPTKTLGQKFVPFRRETEEYRV